MALDHSRDFFGDLRIVPEAIDTTTVALFFTRWITHICAPTFVFLAGVSAWLYGAKRKSKRDLCWFLMSRGIWLILLEFTAIYFALAFSFTILPWMFLVISAIGVSMVALSLLCFLPTNLVGIIGCLIIISHNLLDGVAAEQFGRLAVIWNLLHDGPTYLPQFNLEIGYPVLAWIGVIAAGYGFAPVLTWLPNERQRRIFLTGIALTVAFLVVRGINGYGDPEPWTWKYSSVDSSINDATLPAAGQSMDATRTIMSFLKCDKYPPSLAFLLMTLGPALVILAAFDRLHSRNYVIRFLSVFGRVPLFFYVLHFYILHAASILWYWIVRGEPLSPFQAIYGQMSGQPIPPEYGFQSLLLIYVAWLGVLLVMLPLCHLYGKHKRAGKSRIWSYL